MSEDDSGKSEIKPPSQVREFQAGEIEATRRTAEEGTSLPRVRLRITDSLEVLNRMQDAGVIGRFAIGGAIGATFYLEPVPTMDIDVFVALAPAGKSQFLSLEPIYEYLRSHGFEPIGESIKIHDWLVQFLPVTGPLVEEAIVRAREETVGTTKTFVFTAEHLVAIALETGRAKDKVRVIQFLESGKIDMVALEDVIQRHGLSDRWIRFKQQYLNNS